MIELPTERQQIAARLKAARLGAELDPKTVAQRVDVQVKAFYHWETGHAMPDIVAFKTLARLYGVSADLLLFGSKFKFFSEQLELRLQQLDPAEGARVEDIVRAALGMEPVGRSQPSAGKSAAG